MKLHYLSKSENVEIAVQEGSVVMYFGPDEHELTAMILQGMINIAEEEHKEFLRDYLFRIQGNPTGTLQ